MSCDKSNNGCKGGFINNSLNYIKNKGREINNYKGIVSESCFGYEADSDTVNCNKKCKNETGVRAWSCLETKTWSPKTSKWEFI